MKTSNLVAFLAITLAGAGIYSFKGENKINSEPIVPSVRVSDTNLGHSNIPSIRNIVDLQNGTDSSSGIELVINQFDADKWRDEILSSDSYIFTYLTDEMKNRVSLPSKDSFISSSLRKFNEVSNLTIDDVTLLYGEDLPESLRVKFEGLPNETLISDVYDIPTAQDLSDYFESNVSARDNYVLNKQYSNLANVVGYYRFDELRGLKDPDINPKTFSESIGSQIEALILRDINIDPEEYFKLSSAYFDNCVGFYGDFEGFSQEDMIDSKENLTNLFYKQAKVHSKEIFDGDLGVLWDIYSKKN